MATSGYADLGTYDYTYDASSNVLSALQSATMDELDADRHFTYDSLNRLISGRLTDTQDWTAASEETTSYQYDNLGNRVSHSYRDAANIAYGHDKAGNLTNGSSIAASPANTGTTPSTS